MHDVYVAPIFSKDVHPPLLASPIVHSSPILLATYFRDPHRRYLPRNRDPSPLFVQSAVKTILQVPRFGHHYRPPNGPNLSSDLSGRLPLSYTILRRSGTNIHPVEHPSGHDLQQVHSSHAE